MLAQKTVMIALVELMPRNAGVFSPGILEGQVTSERLHRILDINGILALPGTDHVSPQMFSVDEDEAINMAVVETALKANKLSAISLENMGIKSDACLAIKAHCVISNQTIQVAEVKTPSQRGEPKPVNGPKFMGDNWGISKERLVFFTVQTKTDSWVYTDGGVFTKSEHWNADKTIACQVDKPEYWMDMAKEATRVAEEQFREEELDGAILTVWRWNEQGANESVHTRKLGKKVIQLEVVAVRKPVNLNEAIIDDYKSIPNAKDFKSEYLLNEFTLEEIMEKIVQLFNNPEADSMASHDLAERSIRWEFPLEGIIAPDVRTAVVYIMACKGWTVFFEDKEPKVKMVITASYKE